MNRAAFRRFEFFEFDSVSQNLSSAIGGVPTCAIAESGMLIFGDELGNIIFTDRVLKVTDKKHKIYNGEVIGLAYIFDSSNHNRQYIITLGDDARPTFDPSESYGTANVSQNNGLYLIKVFNVTDLAHPIQVINATLPETMITSFAVQMDGLEVAIGYMNGRVLLFSNVLNKEGATRIPPPAVLLSQHFAAVSALYFVETGGHSHSTHRNHHHHYKSSSTSAVSAQPPADTKRIKLFVVMDTKESSTTLSSLANTANNANPEEKDGNSSPVPPGMLLDEDDIQHAGIIVFDVSLTYNPSKASYVLSSRLQSPKALDEKGADQFNSSYFSGTRELIIARNEAIYTYTADDRGAAVAVFGEKVGVHTVGRYTLVISMDEKNPTTSSVAGNAVDGSLANNPAAMGLMAGLGAGMITSSSTTTGTTMTIMKARKATINLYDLKNRYICGTNKKQFLPANDRLILITSEGGYVYIITANGLLMRFREKDSHQKMKVLLEQANPPLYPLAIQLAGEEQLDSSEIMKLYKNYGDYLYGKRDYDGSITQYAQTIGAVPPSYVILKFLDPYRIQNLIVYLEKIKEKGLATANHVTLLLSCYTKVKEEMKIHLLLESIYEQVKRLEDQQDSSIGAMAAAGKKTAAGGGLDLMNTFQKNILEKDGNAGAASLPMIFDPIQAIQTLHNAGYLEIALRTAIRYKQHEFYFKIQLGKQPPQYDEALGYLAYIAFLASTEELVYLILTFGSSLLVNRPKAFTNLMIKIASGTLETLLTALQQAQATAAAATGGDLATTGSATAGAALKRTNSLKTPTNAAAANSNNTAATNELIALTNFLKTFTIYLEKKKISSIPKDLLYSFPIQEILPIFADENEALTQFLEGIIQSTNKNRILPAKVWMTLLEMYMIQYENLAEKEGQGSGQGQGQQGKAIIESKIMNILDGANVSYDSAHVLLLCHIYSFEKGERYLLEKQNYIELVILKLMETNSNSNSNSSNSSMELFKLLRREGTKDSELFIQVLTYLVQQTMIESGNNNNNNSNSNNKMLNIEDQVAAAADDEEAAENLRDSSNNQRLMADNFQSINEEDEIGRYDTIIDVLDLIEKEGILSPVQVFSILALNLRLPMHIVAGYVQSTFRELSDDVASIEADVKEAKNKLDHAISTAAAEIEMRKSHNRKDSNSSSTGKNPFAPQKSAISKANNNNNNSANNNNKRYDGYDHDEDEDEEDEEERLALLQKEKDRWLGIRERLIECSNDHESFYKELEMSTDGFATVAGYFGRSLITWT